MRNLITIIIIIIYGRFWKQSQLLLYKTTLHNPYFVVSLLYTYVMPRIRDTVLSVIVTRH